MAARPILACEIAAGGVAEEGGATNDGTDNLHNKVQNAVIRTVYHDNVKKKPCPKHLYSPTLADLQGQAVVKGFSGRGEMFSAKAIAYLAVEHQCGRYNVRLVEKSTTEENSSRPKGKDVNYESDNSFDNSYSNLKDFPIEIRDCSKLPLCSNEHKVLTSKLCVSNWITNIVERLMNGNLIAIW